MTVWAVGRWINGLLNIAGHSHGAHGTLDFADMREFDIGLETSRYINIYAQRRFQVGTT